MKTIGDRYIGGGKLFFTPTKRDGTLGNEFEICEVQSGQLTWNIEKKEAFSKDRVVKQMVEQIVTNIEGTFKFTTQVFSLENLAMSRMGALEVESFDIGDTLPDGTIATIKTDIKVIKMAENPILNGKLRFVGDEDGASKPVLVLYNVSMAPSGDFDYISEEFAQLSFEAAVMKGAEGYAKEYWMEVGE
ncbi:hypothetical protein AAX26_01811 [Aliarcobacter thereius]|uniref:hypothetical protein n=1 Tax=Aliarcobacter thereius TaxID=544718 RepID=UPI000828FB56|nr:hypothetical protein [Aliarcobacter thereius]OCL85744.1 hypothetical protein AAX26_01811 [Aliarcobacter thereius]OCL85802.1 hypothetical protein AAX27_02132 [Aliarcobacter thereius]